MAEPTTVILVYFAIGCAYAAACVAMLIRDRVPVAGIGVWRGLLMVAGAWPLVLVMVAVSKVRRAVRKWAMRAHWMGS